MSDAQSFTNRARRRTTKASVRWIDFAAKWGIVCGGIGTIAVVLLVCVYLAWVTLPLFLSPQLEGTTALGPMPWGTAEPVAVGTDDQHQLGWALLPEGRLVAYRLDAAPGDRIVSDERLFGEEKPTAFSAAAGTTDFAVGFASGRIRRGKVNVVRRVVTSEQSPELWKQIPPRATVIADGQLVQRPTTEFDFRAVRVVADFEPPIDVAPNTSVALVDQSIRPSGPILATLDGDGKLRLHSVRSQLNLATGKATSTLVSTDVPFIKRTTGAPPRYLLISGVGDDLFLVWNDGLLRRYNVRDAAKPFLAEEVDLVPEENAELTAFTAMIGKATLVAGDSLGRTRGWFRITPEQSETAAAQAVASPSPGVANPQSAEPQSDGNRLAPVHELAAGPAAATRIAPSSSTRLLSVGYADGSLGIFNMTTDARLLELQPSAESATAKSPVVAAGLSPRDDGLVAVASSQATYWKINPRHPEVSFASLFTPVWYEGTPRPQHVWQSSSGSDSYEPKYGFGPLVFGTCKAAFYSLLFAVPIALLAAIYTSEFLSAKSKGWVKPTIELMSGLPSVVLGFMAALVLAPIVERIVGQVLTAVVLTPAVALLGAHLWQLLPRSRRLAWDHLRFYFIIAALLLGPIAGWMLGPTVESLFFGGNVRDWLSGRVGTAAGGWTFMLLPPAAIVVGWLFARYVTPIVRDRFENSSDFVSAAAELGVFLVGCGAALVVACLVGGLFSLAGFDPRASLVGEYKQLNTMIVGLAMGFAIIPIIFTIAEDALSTVPSHLRSASLGAGATKWQTALRIVVPTAMSGLFSAVMVGLGRAVGETMIVLMAAGNTAIIDVNVFNGFRTLPANIAVELPEAVRDSTHYRTLFLAALVLFGLTFILNTAAELVRQRFRKRAYQL